MAHEIYVNENGKAAMAYVGETPWHNLGQKLDENSSIDTWVVEAGFDWNIKSKAVKYHKADGKLAIIPGQKVLTRSDTGIPLGIVSDAYKIVQPKEVMYFFQDLVDKAGMKLSTAGVLFDGRRFWAMADTHNWGKLNGNDEIKGNLLLSTSCDGSSATTATFVATRVVCANTLRVALDEKTKGTVKVNHRRVFDANEVKEKLGLINESWETFMDNITKLSESQISKLEAEVLVEDFLSNIIKSDKSAKRQTESILNKFQTGLGNNGQTKWDLLNGITEHFQHGPSRVRKEDQKFWNNFYGHTANIKDQAMDFLIQTV